MLWDKEAKGEFDAGIGLCGGEEVLSALGLFHCSCFTSVLAMACLLWVLFLCLVCVLLVGVFALFLLGFSASLVHT